ncbi:hypothetical protein [Virgibacillus sp. DJP39]|uniref:hypothetical protein n=1 Tax=Virgibacillus sp. DJP39 TaxID=3409790 RepID=UPI003BB48C2D
MHIDENLKEHLTMANLYFLLAKKYEYVDHQKHMYYYQKHFYYADLVDKCYMQMEGQMTEPYNALPYNNYNTMH